MRLFIAINFDGSTKDSLLAFENKLRRLGVRGNFSDRDNLHITLAFIGETNRVRDIESIMNKVPHKPFSLTLEGCGQFGTDSILYVDVKRNEELTALASELWKFLSQIGFEIENKKYHPHITIVRKFSPGLPDGLTFAPIDIRVDKISLMKSEHINGRLTYTEIFSEKLQ